MTDMICDYLFLRLQYYDIKNVTSEGMQYSLGKITRVILACGCREIPHHLSASLILIVFKLFLCVSKCVTITESKLSPNFFFLIYCVGEYKVFLDPVKFHAWFWKLNWRKQTDKRKAFKLIYCKFYMTQEPS